MKIIEIIIIAFIFLEISNVIMLYFAPGSRIANAVGVFESWEKSKQYPEIHDFHRDVNSEYIRVWVSSQSYRKSTVPLQEDGTYDFINLDNEYS